MMSEKEMLLLEMLTKLPVAARTVFAALCAERMLRGFQACALTAQGERYVQLSGALNRLWQDLTKKAPYRLGELNAQLRMVMSLIPDENTQPWTADFPVAEDSASAVAYALRCKQAGDPREAAWSALRARNGVQAIADMNNHSANQSRELLEEEWVRQFQYLEELSTTSLSPELLSRLRARAQRGSDR
jgi:uncharacterized protein YjaG (DUF416 family)